MEIVCEILDVQTKADILGRVLKLSVATVESIRERYDDPQDRLFHVIDEFVKQVEPRPTGKLILEALRSPLIKQPRLAEGLEDKYCPPPPKPQDGMLMLSAGFWCMTWGVS